jgi:hypothetical protein
MQTGGAIGGSGEYFRTGRATIARISFSKARYCSRLSHITSRLRPMELDLSRVAWDITFVVNASVAMIFPQLCARVSRRRTHDMRRAHG